MPPAFEHPAELYARRTWFGVDDMWTVTVRGRPFSIHFSLLTGTSVFLLKACAQMQQTQNPTRTITINHLDPREFEVYEQWLLTSKLDHILHESLFQWLCHDKAKTCLSDVHMLMDEILDYYILGDDLRDRCFQDALMTVLLRIVSSAQITPRLSFIKRVYDRLVESSKVRTYLVDLAVYGLGKEAIRTVTRRGDYVPRDFLVEVVEKFVSCRVEHTLLGEAFDGIDHKCLYHYHAGTGGGLKSCPDREIQDPATIPMPNFDILGMPILRI